VEAHSLAQGDAVSAPVVADFVLLGQHRDGVQVLVVRVERLVHVPGDLLRDDRSGRMQIEGRRLADEPRFEHTTHARLLLGVGAGHGREDEQ